MATRQLVVFSLDGQHFAVDITKVHEITPPQDIYKVPNTPEFIEGLINFRGKVHTVFNLRKRFDMPDHVQDENTKIIIVNENSTMVGVIVDEVSEILKIEEEELEKTPKAVEGVNRKFLSGVAKLSDKIVLLLDISQVLSIA